MNQETQVKKTQILITDIPKEKFVSKWPQELEEKIFDENFPNLKINLQYFTPLQFLSRIVIIMNDQESTDVIYEFLQKLMKELAPTPIKLYLTESLLVNNAKGDSNRPPIRSRSFDDMEKINDNNDGKNSLQKPILSIDTDPVRTGIAVGSLALGGPSLSPDRRTSIESPTLLKFAPDSKSIYYKEPAPKISPQSTKESSSSPVDGSQTKYLFQPPPPSSDVVNSNAIRPNTLKVNTSSSTSSLSVASGKDSSSTPNTPPKSPTITLNEFAH
ncbi:Rcn2p NDAI_0E01420 [Naumovozyma dairenensis CBS 421]|uniref:Uncharacterized protein n=1 Tax=Naumovozyma dairenensis (strain ATCC 10597 / BCRC 20456 / CBS 421 / NBRC 0211 / NRRL Y-12639) TaxID=1071378 RepID=G0WB38_NAUDC|nr:hypothetical protein NDAI_0E01420 [Naumovozyma dairenensis CBS 421]CCD24958.1 hypothetical protein NDAI_0E01420 [Naumovozyma dairenensis CBS 421]